VLAAIANDFSPRFEAHGNDLVVVDASGLGRLLGPPRAIGEELRRAAAARGARLHIAVAGTQVAAMILVRAQPGLTVVPPGGEAAALAPVRIEVLANAKSEVRSLKPEGSNDSLRTSNFGLQTSDFRLQTFTQWGIKTLGELAALPPADLAARLGRFGPMWQAIARGEDVRPLVPTLDEERFESTIELEWPIEGLEPLSFVLTRLLEPLSTRLERRDRGAAVLHVLLELVGTGSPLHARRLELPTPLRDVRSLRTLALLDLESHPPDAAVERVTLVIDPTPGRVLQHTLFTRAHPAPEQIATLLARLGALMGQDRIGAPGIVDTYRPGAFVMKAFATEHTALGAKSEVRSQKSEGSNDPLQTSDFKLQTSLRCCRHAVPARVAVADGRPVRVTTDRRGFGGGAVLQCAGPWRTSGEWWTSGTSEVRSLKSEGSNDSLQRSDFRPLQTSDFRLQTFDMSWNRDEWDVALNDGGVYRVFLDRDTDAWYVDAIVD